MIGRARSGGKFRSVREGRKVQECSGYRVSSTAGETGDDEIPTVITI
jgi:hypothetical protein